MCAYNIIVAVLNGVVAVCYLVSEVCVIVVIVNRVIVYKLATVNVDFAKVFGINSFVDVENVPFTFTLLCSFELAAVNVNDTVSCGGNNCTVGSRVIITAIDVYNCAIGRGNNRVGSAARAALHRALTVNGNYGSGTLCPKNFNNAVFVNPISGNGVAAKVDDNLFAFDFNCACEFNVIGQDYAIACCENRLEVSLVCNFNDCAFFNNFSLVFASADSCVIKYAVNNGVCFGCCVTGCRNDFLSNGCISTSGAVLTCGQTVLGTSSSYCLVNNDVVTESIGVIGIVAITACAGVDGVASCRTCGINYGAGSMNMCVIKGRNGFCYNITASSANLVLCTFCTFGSGSIDNPITIGVTQSIGRNSFSGKLFSANGAVNYVIIASGAFAGSCYRVFNNDFTFYAIGHLFAAPIAVVVIGDVLAMRILNAAPITEVILIGILTIAHFILTNIALVVLVSVDTFGSGKTAEVTFVVGVKVCTLSKLCSANITLVIVVCIFALGKSLAANVALVILIAVCTVGHLFAAPIAVVVIGDVLAMRVLSAANITEVVLISIVALGDLSVTDVTDVIVVIILAIAYRKEASITFVVGVKVCTLGKCFSTDVTFVVERCIDALGKDFGTNVALVILIAVCTLGECFAASVAFVIVVVVCVLGGAFFAALVTGCITIIVVSVLARSFATLRSGVGAGQLVNNYVCLTGAIASEERRIIGGVVSQPVASIGAVCLNGSVSVSSDFNGPAAVVIQCGLGL